MASMEPIIYFSSKSENYPQLSNFWIQPFVFQDVAYKNVEEAFQAQKALLFNDKEAFTRICQSKTPASAKSLGRKVQWFEKDKWMEMKRDVMYELLKAKFQQHADLKAILLGTAPSILAEATRDTYWGIGAKKGALEGNQKVWGHNHLGKLLTRLRNELQE